MRLRRVSSVGISCVGAVLLASACGEDHYLDDAQFCREHPGVCVGSAGGVGGAEGAGVGGASGSSGSGSGGAAGCDGREKPEASTTAFVSPQGSDARGDGSVDKPFATVAHALQAGKGTVALAHGTYALEATLAVSAALTLDGAWTAQGTRDCAADAASKTVLVGKDASVSPVVKVTAGTVRVAGLTVKTVEKAPAAVADTAGTSLVAVQVEGGQVRVEQAALWAGDAGEGGVASASSTEDPGATVCNGVTDCLCDAVNRDPYNYDAYLACLSQDPQPQLGQTPTTGMTLGAKFLPTGYVPGDGAQGGPGTSGQNGRNGAPGQTKAQAPLRCVCVGKGEACNAQDFCPHQDMMTSCAQAQLPGVSEPTAANGRCGCGGKGGVGGRPGRGGGVSVALVASGGQVTVVDATLRSGRGGKGAVGATGGAGGTPTGGQLGQTCVATMASGSSQAPCAWSGGLCFATTTKDGGDAGRSGAKGGQGAQGGPGAGGPSYGIVTVGSAMVTRGAGVTITPGQAGKGATGAPDGEVAEQKAF